MMPDPLSDPAIAAACAAYEAESGWQANPHALMAAIETWFAITALTQALAPLPIEEAGDADQS